LTTSAVDVSKFLWDKVGFEPHPEQETVLRCGKRFILVAGGDQSGKSITGAKYLLQRFSEPEDPGYGSDSAHAIHAVQIIDGQIRVFDEIYERNLITEDIIDICKGKNWWKDVKWLVSDPSYKDQHHSMNSVGEQWLKSTGLFATGRKVRINEGTERLKGFLKPDSINGVPKIVYSPKCTGVLSEFGAAPNPFDGQTRAYRWKTDREGNIVGNIPEDKWNHAVKADIYGIVDNYGYGHVRSGDKIRVKRW
jgi:hypothetical protein